MAQLASLADETPEGRSHRRAGQAAIQHPRTRHGRAAARVRAVQRQHPHERRRSSATRQVRKGAADAVRKHVEALGRPYPGRGGAPGRRRVAPRQHAAGGGRRRPRDGRGGTEGHRQGRHQGALRRTAPHGHQDGDDHRRQQADRRRHRRRSRASTISWPKPPRKTSSS